MLSYNFFKLQNEKKTNLTKIINTEQHSHDSKWENLNKCAEAVNLTICNGVRKTKSRYQIICSSSFPILWKVPKTTKIPQKHTHTHKLVHMSMGQLTIESEYEREREQSLPRALTIRETPFGHNYFTNKNCRWNECDEDENVCQFVWPITIIPLSPSLSYQCIDNVMRCDVPMCAAIQCVSVFVCECAHFLFWKRVNEWVCERPIHSSI